MKGYNRYSRCNQVVQLTMKRESLTIRFPTDLLAQAKALKVDAESL